MQVTTLTEAISLCRTARMMCNDLPDGQWEEIKDLMSDFGITFKTKLEDVDADTAGEFITELNRNLVWWI